jgi:hypothetical protein
MRVTSSAFEPGGSIPTRHSCDGADVSPTLAVEGIPAGAVSLALVMDDPDAPGGTWDHWVSYDIPPTSSIAEGVANLGTPGVNSWGITGYRGPCCPRGQTHRYVVTVYALDANLGLPVGATRERLLAALRGHLLAEASLAGRFSRPR